MHYNTPEFKALLKGEVTTFAICCRLQRSDGIVMGFTSADHDLYVDHVVYRASSGLSPSAVSSLSGLGIDDLEIEGILESDCITEEDILAGRYDNAQINVFLMDYLNVSAGKIDLRTGWIGEVKTSCNHFVAEMRGLVQAFSKNIGELYSPSCRANFCDARCGLDINSYTFSGQVQQVKSNTNFSAEGFTQDNGYFTYGKVKFTSGKNINQTMEIRTHNHGNIELMLPLPYEPEGGDSFLITAGCDKRFETCINKFSNAINFRGEPHVPLPEKFAG